MTQDQTNPSRTPDILSWAIRAAFFCSLVFVGAVERSTMESARHWGEGALLVLSVAVAMMPSNLGVPFQNLLLSSAIVGIVSSVALASAAFLPEPIRPLFPEHLAIATWPEAAHWLLPLAWIVFVHTARGGARWVLLRWRDNPRYGLWSIALTAALAAVAASVFDSFAWRSIAETNALSVGNDAVLMRFALFWLIAAIASVLTIPAWINKRPAPERPHVFPLVAWVLFTALFTVAAIRASFR